MPITEKQRQRRRNHIGASDMAAIMGLSPWRTPYDVWAEKTGRLVDEADPDNEVMALGTLLETGVLDFAGSVLGPIRRNQFRKHPSLPIGGHLDAIRVGTNEPVEAKTAGLLGPLREPWGDEGTDHVPDRILIQVHTQCLALAPVEVERAYVAALLGGQGLRLYSIQVNRDVMAAIAEAAERFWSQHVQADTPPEGTPSLAVAKLIRRTPNKTVSVPETLFTFLLDAKAKLNEADVAHRLAKAELLAAMGDADSAIAIDREDAFTFYEQTRTAYTVPEQTYRVLRYRKKGLPEQ